MSGAEGTGDGVGLREIDRRLLGLEVVDGATGALTLRVEKHLSRTDGRFYGGAALAAALAASEAATGRPALWSATQLVATADLGETVRIVVDRVASGRSVDQVQVHARVGDRLIFSAVGSTGTPRADGLQGTARRMPAVLPPGECGPWNMLGPDRGDLEGAFGSERPAVGHQLVTEIRDATLLRPDPDRPGHMTLWARITDEVSQGSREMSPAVIGFLADMVPLAVCRALGVMGAGTSLDNSLRVGEPADTDWVLLDLDADLAVGGFGHGTVLVWSPDGRLLATGSQSARLFTIQHFVERLARGDQA